MQISVPSLSAGRHVLRTSTPAANYGELAKEARLEFHGNIEVEAVVDKMGEELFVKATVSAPVKLECARCLEPVKQPLVASFEALFVPDRSEGMEQQFTRPVDEEFDVLTYTGGFVDLGEEIIESLVVAVPMKPLCKPDCRGLCPSCGSNLNVEKCTCPSGGGLILPFKGLFGPSS